MLPATGSGLTVVVIALGAVSIAVGVLTVACSRRHRGAAAAFLAALAVGAGALVSEPVEAETQPCPPTTTPATTPPTTTAPATSAPTTAPTTTALEPAGFAPPATPPGTTAGVSLSVSNTSPDRGEAIDVTGTGFPADATIHIVLYSEPVVLGTTSADNSRFSTTVTIPAATTLGTHTLAVFGGTATGVLELNVGDVQPPDATDKTVELVGTEMAQGSLLDGDDLGNPEAEIISVTDERTGDPLAPILTHTLDGVDAAGDTAPCGEFAFAVDLAAFDDGFYKFFGARVTTTVTCQVRYSIGDPGSHTDLGSVRFVVTPGRPPTAENDIVEVDYGSEYTGDMLANDDLGSPSAFVALMWHLNASTRNADLILERGVPTAIVGWTVENEIVECGVVTVTIEDDGAPNYHFASVDSGKLDFCYVGYEINNGYGIDSAFLVFEFPDSIDDSPPEVTAAVDPETPGSGWHTGDVTITWEVSDPDSAIIGTTGCEEVTITTDTDRDGIEPTCEATSAGGTTTESVTILRDATAPTVTCPTPTPVFAGSSPPAVVTATIEDAGSGPAATTVSAEVDTAVGGAGSIELTGRDNAGNTTAVECPYIVDATEPEVTANIDPSTPASGWHTGDVTVTWTVTDPESAVTVDSGCDEVTIATDTGPDGVDVSCAASSLGGTNNTSITIRRDATTPTVTCPDPAPQFAVGAADATVTASVTDTGSGPEAATVSAEAHTATAGESSVAVTGSDTAGNSVTVSCPYDVIGDTTPPEVFANVFDGDWYSGEVTVSWTVSDPESAVTTTCPDTTLRNEGANQQVTCTATSSGGTTTETVNIHIDSTEPTITCTGLPSFELNQPNATVTATVTDNLSGVDVTELSTIVDTSRAGEYLVDFDVEDRAGNMAFESCDYEVEEPFE